MDAGIAPPIVVERSCATLALPKWQDSYRSASFSSPHENRFAGFSRGPRWSCQRKPSRGPSRRCAAHLGGPCTVQKTRQEGDFGLGPPLRRYDFRPLLGPPIVPLPRKSARFIRRRRRFADFPPPGPPLQTTQRGGHSPLFGNTPNGAAAGPKVERFNKHPEICGSETGCGISVI